MTLIQLTKEKKFQTYSDLLGTTTTLFYIIFSIIDRFAENLIFIPLILYVANVLILIDFFYSYRKPPANKSDRRSKRWLIALLIINILGVSICLSYFI